MNKYNYDGPEQFRPLSPWAYLGYTILFAIPLVGFILLIVFSLNSDNINRRNFARSFWCSLLIALIISIIIGIFVGPSFVQAINQLRYAYH